jgi:hypothetical protein
MKTLSDIARESRTHILTVRKVAKAKGLPPCNEELRGERLYQWWSAQDAAVLVEACREQRNRRGPKTLPKDTPRAQPQDAPERPRFVQTELPLGNPHNPRFEAVATALELLANAIRSL